MDSSVKWNMTNPKFNSRLTFQEKALGIFEIFCLDFDSNRSKLEKNAGYVDKI